MAKVTNTNKKELTLAQKVQDDNEYQQEIRQDAPTLYESLLANWLYHNDRLENWESKYDVEQQFYYKGSVQRYGSNNEYIDKHIQWNEPKMNELVYKMCEKYADNSGITTGDRQGNNKLQMTMSNRTMERDEIELLLALFVRDFHTGQIDLMTDDNEMLSFTVKPVIEFAGDNLKHSNNKLLKYIAKSFERNVMTQYFERKNKVIKYKPNGKEYRVMQQIEECSFEDIKVGGVDEEGNQLTLVDVLSADDRVENYKYQATKESLFIRDNYAEIMTKKQADVFAGLLARVKSGELDIDDLFHKVTGQIETQAWGRALWPDRSDNIQKDTGKFFESVRYRMEKAMNKKGMSLYADRVEIRSTQARFPHLSMAENKLWTDYQVESKIKRRFDWEDNPIYANVRKFDEDRVVDQSDVELVEQGLMTVEELIDKYKLTKNETEKTYWRLNEIEVEKKKNDM